MQRLAYFRRLRINDFVAAAIHRIATTRVGLIYDRFHYGALGAYLWHSRRIPGWTRGAEAVALAEASRALSEAAVIVEIGSFLGSSAVLLAGARKLRGSGKVHCVDPFDASGDAFSAPFYRRIAGATGVSLRQQFENNIREVGLSQWVEIHPGRASDVAATWSGSIDLLFLDGDQSPAGARVAYHAWAPFLQPGGIIAVHNSGPGVYHESHGGHRRLVMATIRPPDYVAVRCVGATNFARRAKDHDVSDRADCRNRLPGELL